MAVPSQDRIDLAKRRLQNVLRDHIIATARTLENKISDAGPFNQRVDPHILTIARNQLQASGIIRVFFEREGSVRWYYLSSTPKEQLDERYKELDAIHRSTQDKDFVLRVGQSLEIAVSKALQQQNLLHSMGHFRDLHNHDDSTLYSKEDPPSLINNRSISGKRKLDFLLVSPTAGVAGIEVKNIREWIYVDRDEVKEMLAKCCQLNAIPILIARRIAYETFSVLNGCGVLIHQSYNQLYPQHDQQLAEKVKDKRLLGYHDVRVGNEPDTRLLKFAQVNLPKILDQARQAFDQHQQLLLDFAEGNIPYKELVGRVRGRTPRSEDIDPYEGFGEDPAFDEPSDL